MIFLVTRDISFNKEIINDKHLALNLNSNITCFLLFFPLFSLMINVNYYLLYNKYVDKQKFGNKIYTDNNNIFRYKIITEIKAAIKVLDIKISTSTFTNKIFK